MSVHSNPKSIPIYQQYSVVTHRRRCSNYISHEYIHISSPETWLLPTLTFHTPDKGKKFYTIQINSFSVFKLAVINKSNHNHINLKVQLDKYLICGFCQNSLGVGQIVLLTANALSNMSDVQLKDLLQCDGFFFFRHKQPYNLYFFK